MEFHDIAEKFPMMNSDELEDLIADIKANGLIEPIVLYEDKILDGRNRYLACGEAGVKPHYDYYKGDEPVSFVASKNLHRRHLNASQRAMIASDVKPMLEEEAKRRMTAGINQYSSPSELIHEGKGRSDNKAGELFGVSGRYVSDAEKIKNEAPEYVEPIMSGDMTITQAKKEIKRKEHVEKALSKPKPRTTNTVNIYFGDIKNVIPSLGLYDLIVADPPYNVTNWEWDIIGDDFLKLTTKWINLCKNHLQDEYNLFWFCSPKYASDIEIVLRGADLKIQSRVVWHRRNMSMGSDAKNKFIDTWEMIFHCGNRALNFGNNWGDERFDVQTFAVPQTNFNDTKLHPTQKPLKLIEWLVKHGSYEGDNILDPFAGSGTTGEACNKLNRNCDLIENEREYIDIIKRRVPNGIIQ